MPVPTSPQRHGSTITTLVQARAEFLRHRSVWVLLPALALAVGLRAGLGGALGWGDLVAATVLAGVFPFAEWAIHVHLLHLPPVRWRGRRVELVTAAAHRSHHEHPHDLGRILLGPGEAAALLFAVVPLVVGAGAAVVTLAGGTPGLGPVLTAVSTAYALIVAYEWTHLLIHTAYRPRRAAYRAVHRGHRLHHFKNERYWNGVTSTVADRLLGTAPDHRQIPRSPTARSLDRAGRSR